MIRLDPPYRELPERFFERISPATFPDPQLIQFNKPLAQELGMDIQDLSEAELAALFSGQKTIAGAEPMALAYAGSQFGHFVPQLGDGRAHVLGELSGFDIQLKGSGRTRFSRGGDGRSPLGPVLREYLVSEAMHALKVPTTRALCAVSTGEMVMRQFGPVPGAVLTRVAASHLRVGTFQYFAARGDQAGLEILLDYTLKRHYPHLLAKRDLSERSLALLKEVCQKQAKLVAQWHGLGFIHGVMNTDNTSLAGITLDYGPCAFMDQFNFDQVFSSIDQQGRYNYFNQAPVAQWNMLRLAECLLPLIHPSTEQAQRIVQEKLQTDLDYIEQHRFELLAQKLGIEDYAGPEDRELVLLFLNYLQEQQLDFTLSFRHLPQLFAGEYDSSDFSYPRVPQGQRFLERWRERVKQVDHLLEINPALIPRNHWIERSIQAASQGDFSDFKRLHEILQRPFENPPPDWRPLPSPSQTVYRTFCGT